MKTIHLPKFVPVACACGNIIGEGAVLNVDHEAFGPGWEKTNDYLVLKGVHIGRNGGLISKYLHGSICERCAVCRRDPLKRKKAAP